MFGKRKNGAVGAHISPDANSIRAGDNVYYFDGLNPVDGDGRGAKEAYKPMARRVVRVYQPSEADALIPGGGPYKYPLLEFDDGTRGIAADFMSERTCDGIYGKRPTGWPNGRDPRGNR